METRNLPQPFNDPRSSISWYSQNTSTVTDVYSGLDIRDVPGYYRIMQTRTLPQTVNEPRSSTSWSSQNTGTVTVVYLGLDLRYSLG
jgi:hypothetical protein